VNKTIYVREDDGAIWGRARELAGEKLSPVIVAALRRFVAEKEAESAGFEKILLRFDDANDSYLPKAKSFYGRWIIPPDERFVDWSADNGSRHHAAVAVTPKNKVVLYAWGSKNGEPDDDFSFQVFDSFSQAAAQDVSGAPIREAVERIGVPVEDLDI
jgi:hypothetical protein